MALFICRRPASRRVASLLNDPEVDLILLFDAVRILKPSLIPVIDLETSPIRFAGVGRPHSGLLCL